MSGVYKVDNKLVTIICPVYNEEESIPIFYDRVRQAIAPLLSSYRFELLFTNNRSHDRTLATILALRESDPSVQALTLSRNFGYQASVMAGMRHANGDAIIVIDVDCEDPPELIPVFIEEWQRGYDLVYGDRKKRSESYAVQLARLAFYRLNRLLADSEIILDMAEFALISKRMREVMLANRSTFPFLRAEAGYAGFERKGISYKRQPRVRGTTHYNFFGMAKFAIAGILSSSTFPLRLVAYLCAPLLLLNLLLAALDLASSLEKAFHLLIIVDLLYLVFCCACIAIYLARDYKNGVARPIFIVDWEKSALNQSDEYWITDHEQTHLGA